MKRFVASLLLGLFLSYALRPSAAMGGSDATWDGKSVRQLADQLSDKDLGTRWYAAYALGQLGAKAVDAIPELHKVLERHSEQEYVRDTAAWAMGCIGPSAVSELPLLVETMHSTLPSVRRNSAEALGKFGAAAKPAVDDLLKLLNDDDQITRVDASVALWKIARHPKSLPALAEVLRKGTAPAPYSAVVALGPLGADSDGADLETIVPLLIEALRQPDADVRRAAARSLGQIGQAGFPALKKANALADPNDDTRRLVVEALGWMGPVAVRPLTAALSDGSPGVRRESARALGRLGLAAKSAQAALVAAVNDPEEEVRLAAAEALRRIRSQ